MNLISKLGVGLAVATGATVVGLGARFIKEYIDAERKHQEGKEDRESKWTQEFEEMYK